jgi:hypothetical protein
LSAKNECHTFSLVLAGVHSDVMSIAAPPPTLQGTEVNMAQQWRKFLIQVAGLPVRGSNMSDQQLLNKALQKGMHMPDVETCPLPGGYEFKLFSTPMESRLGNRGTPALPAS